MHALNRNRQLGGVTREKTTELPSKLRLYLERLYKVQNKTFICHLMPVVGIVLKSFSTLQSRSVIFVSCVIKCGIYCLLDGNDLIFPDRNRVYFIYFFTQKNVSIFSQVPC